MILKILFDKEKVNEEQDVPERTQATRFLGSQFLCLRSRELGWWLSKAPSSKKPGCGVDRCV